MSSPMAATYSFVVQWIATYKNPVIARLNIMSQHSANFLRIFILSEGFSGFMNVSEIISQKFTMVCTSYCSEFVIKSTRGWWILSNRKMKGWKSWLFCNKCFAFKHNASAISSEQRLSSKTWFKICDNTKFYFSTSPLDQGDLGPVVWSLVLRGLQRRNIPSLMNYQCCGSGIYQLGYIFISNILIVCLSYYCTWNG